MRRHGCQLRDDRVRQLAFALFLDGAREGEVPGGGHEDGEECGAPGGEDGVGGDGGGVGGVLGGGEGGGGDVEGGVFGDVAHYRCEAVVVVFYDGAGD